MKRSNLRPGARLTLEQLECRLVPAITVSEPNGVLTVSGDPAGQLTVTQTAQGTWQVVETGGITYNNVSANGGVRITTQGSDDDVILNSSSFTITGNVFIDLGNGDDHFRLENAGGAMTIAGMLQVNAGSGDDTVTLSPGGASTIQGPVNLIMGSGNDTVAINSNVTIQGDLLVQDANVMNAAADGVTGIQGIINGRATFQFTEGGANALTIGAATTIGSLNVIGGAGNETVTTTAGSVIQQTASVYLGDGTNSFTGNGNVAGALSYTGGVGDDVVSIGGTINGAATVNLGSSAGATQAFTLTGRLKGNVNMSAAGGTTAMTFGGRTDGNLTVTTSSTNNTFMMTGSLFGSAFTYNGGGGVDNVTWAATGGSARFSVNLGAGNDSFALNSANYSGGTIDGGAGTDTFTNTAAIMNLIIRNFEM